MVLPLLLLAAEPDLAGGSGSEISSFIIAGTEVTERAELPWLTLPYSNLLTGRGFTHIFQTSPTADQQAAAGAAPPATCPPTA